MMTASGIQQQLIESHLQAMGHDLRRNILTDRVEDCGEPLDDYKRAAIRNEMRSAGIRSMDYVADVIDEVADRNAYNPVLNYMEHWREVEWDGTDWIHMISLYVEEDVDAGEEGVFELYLRKWMVGAAARVLQQDGCRNPMLVLDGPQDIGKSMFVAWLCPKSLYPAYYKDAQIDPDDKDHKIALSRTFVWEAAELDKTANAKDASKIKSFITEYRVTERGAWKHDPLDLPTIVSFIGTVNNVSGFLNDASGSSRFRVCRIKSIDYEGYTNARPDLIDLAWMQAVHLYMQGETRNLSPEERKHAERINRKYSVINNTKFAIEEYFDIDPEAGLFTTCNYIREVLQRHGLSGADLDAKRIANSLAELGCRRGWKKINKQTKAGYYGISKKLESEAMDQV